MTASTIHRPEFSAITERPDTRASRLQLKMLQTRYDFACRHSAGQVVLECACGAGVGLGLLKNAAEYVIGGDIDARNCATAKRTYAGKKKIEVSLMDAERTPFSDGRFGVVILFEALYYLSAARFLTEAKRLLAPGGLLLVSTVNCEWPEFNPSPFSTQYYGAAGLRQLLTGGGFHADMFGGFPDIKSGLSSVLIGKLKQNAVKYHLIPKTMKGKEWLKEVVYGKLEPIPPDIAQSVQAIEALIPLEVNDTSSSYRMLYAVCRRDS